MFVRVGVCVCVRVLVCMSVCVGECEYHSTFICFLSFNHGESVLVVFCHNAKQEDTN